MKQFAATQLRAFDMIFSLRLYSIQSQYLGCGITRRSARENARKLVAIGLVRFGCLGNGDLLGICHRSVRTISARVRLRVRHREQLLNGMISSGKLLWNVFGIFLWMDNTLKFYFNHYQKHSAVINMFQKGWLVNNWANWKAFESISINFSWFGKGATWFKRIIHLSLGFFLNIVIFFNGLM